MTLRVLVPRPVPLLPQAPVLFDRPFTCGTACFGLRHDPPLHLACGYQISRTVGRSAKYLYAVSPVGHELASLVDLGTECSPLAHNSSRRTAQGCYVYALAPSLE